MKVLVSLFKRDVLVLMRQPGQWLNPLIFFVMVLTLFPLAVNPDPAFLSKIASGIIWVAALLATLLSLDSLFSTDMEDGSLEQWYAAGYSLYSLGLMKSFVHWCMSGLPLTIIAPVLGVMLSLPTQSYFALIGCLLLTTPVFSLIGGIGAALTAGMKSNGVLVSLISMPLYIPVLIFASSAVHQASLEVSYFPQIGFLGAIFLFSVTLAPIAMAGALKMNLVR
jgi:heme exporter protein B